MRTAGSARQLAPSVNYFVLSGGLLCSVGTAALEAGEGTPPGAPEVLVGAPEVPAARGWGLFGKKAVFPCALEKNDILREKQS